MKLMLNNKIHLKDEKGIVFYKIEQSETPQPLFVKERERIYCLTCLFGRVDRI
jgi:hypothetical protein